MGNGVISFILVSNFSCCNVGWPSLSKMAICYAKKKKKKTLFWCWWPVSVSFNDRARPWLTFNVYLLDSPSSKNILVFFKKNLYWKLGQGCHFSSNGRRYSFNFIVLYAYFLRVLFCIIFLFIYFCSVGTNGSL